jgi:CheY-like chemotaxis protein
MRVLVVDDEVEVRRLIGDNIRLWGHEVELASSGPECLTACAAAVPEMLVLDLAMPGQDGASLLRELRRRGTAPDQVVLVSAVPPSQLRLIAQELGVHCLPKPFSVDQLEACVAPLLSA